MNTSTSRPSAHSFLVVGGSGLIGKPLVTRLRALGHTVKIASPSQGVDTVTGEGLAAAIAGTGTVIDVSNSPSFADAAVLDFFTRSTGNLLAAATAAGVRHMVALSVVGADRLPESGYLRAKVAQENLIRASRLPFTLVRATQFFEFAAAIASSATTEGTVRVPAIDMQPIAAADVSAALAELALAEPANGIVELAGPEVMSQAEFVRRELTATRDSRPVTTDPAATYFGARANKGSLIPAPGTAPLLAPTRHADWLAKRAEAATVGSTA